jgi:hypothetical protein
MFILLWHKRNKLQYRHYNPELVALNLVRNVTCALLPCSVTSQVLGQRWSPKLKHCICDTVLPDRPYHAPQGAETDECGAILRWLLAMKIKRNSWEISVLTSLTTAWISYEVTGNWTRGSVMSSQGLGTALVQYTCNGLSFHKCDFIPEPVWYSGRWVNP